MRARAMVGALAAVSLIGVFGCGEKDATAPETGAGSDLSKVERNALAAEVRQLTAGRGITALGRPPRVRPALVELGRALAFDKILSGNRDISCMTCHLPSFATGDARSLSIGQGATGLGPAGSTRRACSSLGTRLRPSISLPWSRCSGMAGCSTMSSVACTLRPVWP